MLTALSPARRRLVLAVQAVPKSVAACPQQRCSRSRSSRVTSEPVDVRPRDELLLRLSKKASKTTVVMALNVRAGCTDLSRLAVLIGIRQAHAPPSTPRPHGQMSVSREVLPSPIPAGTLSPRSVDETVTAIDSRDGCGDGDDFFTKKGSRTARPTASEVPVVTSLRGAHVSCPTGRRRLTSRRTR